MLWRKLHLNWRYGLGEFFIVVLGVLAALWIENWNGDREDRVLERRYVGSLIADLELDDASIRDAMEYAEHVANNGRSVLKSIEDRQFTGTPEDFVRSVNLTAYLRYPTYSRSTINDLMATGNLRLLQSETVRDSIAAYYSAIEWNTQWNESAREAQTLMTFITAALLDVRHREFLDSESFEASGAAPWAPDTLEVSSAEAEEILEALIEHSDAKGLISYMNREQGATFGRLTRIRGELLKSVSVLKEYRDEIRN
jgi:hypothetical protein